MKKQWVPARFLPSALAIGCVLRRFIPQKDLRKLIMKKYVTSKMFEWETDELRHERMTAFAFEFILGEVHQFRMCNVHQAIDLQIEKWGEDEMDVGDQQGRPANEMRLRKFYYSRSYPHILWWWAFPR